MLGFNLGLLTILMVLCITGTKPDVARSELCRLITRLDLPLGIGETEA